MPKLDGAQVSMRFFMDLQEDRIDRQKAYEFYSQYQQDWEKK